MGAVSAPRTPPLLRWFDRHQRELPWRGTRDPYRVWVSEIMLQQTRVETVLRYYEPFLRRFPTVAALAKAPDEQVRAAWSGLGFYRRARNLHHAARRVVDEHEGVVPTDPEVLGDLPGLGRYTVGAVLSIAHDQRLPVVDGNVVRVLSRLHRVAGDPSRGPVQRRLWSLATDALPARRCGDWNQALMELGATVCKPVDPDCPACPLADACAGREHGDAQAFPSPKAKPRVLEVERVAVYLLRADGSFLLVQRPDEGLLASLWELPGADLEPGAGHEPAARRLARGLGVRARLTRRGTAAHVFSHRRWTVHVFAARTRVTRAPARGRWVQDEDLAELGVPTVTRKVLRAAREELQ
jgi:A/G-specific adenine glycosylase